MSKVTSMFEKMNNASARIGFGASVSVVSPDDYGQRYMFRTFFVPVIPSLIEKPILGRFFDDK